MSLPRYSDYKDSGLSWLGPVPSHWGAKPIKAIASLNDDALPDTTSPDYHLSYVDIGSVSLGAGIERTEEFAFAAAPSRARRLVRDGDVIVSTVRTYLKAIAPIVCPPENLVVSTGFAVVRPGPMLDSGFAKYALQSQQFVDQVISRSTGVSYPAINAPDLARIELPAPPKEEQSAIAAFLDRETGKIDALIAEQEKLLTLLTEKRQATISHAVTRGLNPNAPMKDSGVPWLGEVPAHWDVRRVSRSFKAKKGSNAAELTKEYCATIEGDYPVFSGQTENDGIMEFIDRYEFDAAEDGFILSTTVGAKAMSVTHVKGCFSLSQNCMVILPRVNDALTRFFFYHFQPLFFYERRMIPDHMQPSFRMEDLYGYKIGVPPLDEQRVIAFFLDRESEKFDDLRHEMEEAIALLKERRSALIAAAVTGKIDVRQAA
jgi:type I restriction enzyme S subunit